MRKSSLVKVLRNSLSTKLVGGRHSTEVASALLTQPTRVRIPAFPKFFRRIISSSFDVAEVNRRRCLEQWTVA